MTNPVCKTNFGVVQEQLCSESVLMVRIEDIVARYSDSNDFGILPGGRWTEVNTVSNVRQAMRALRSGAYTSVPTHIAVPARYKSGITIFALRDSEASVQLVEREWPDFD